MTRTSLEPPELFSASIGGYMGPTYAVEKVKRGVQYRRYESGYELREIRMIRPDEEAWATFRRALDEIGVWDWLPEYADPGIMDGTGWSLELKWGDRAISTGGSNGYPGGSPDSPEFRGFLDAISSLIGGRPFR